MDGESGESTVLYTDGDERQHFLDEEAFQVESEVVLAPLFSSVHRLKSAAL